MTAGRGPTPFGTKRWTRIGPVGGGYVDVVLILNGHNAIKNASWPRFVEAPS
jgi:hypothetical protein